MNEARTIAAYVLTLCLVAVAVCRPALAQEKPQQVASDLERRLIESQHLEQSASAWRDVIRNPGDAFKGFKLGQVDPVEVWQRSVDKVFDVSEFALALARGQMHGLSAAELEEIQAFDHSPLGKKINKANGSSLPPDVAADPKRMALAFKKADDDLKANRTRQKLVEEIAESSGGVATQVELMLSLSRGVITGVWLATPNASARMSSDDIAKLVEQERPQRTKELRALMLPVLGLMLKDISTRELQDYLKVLKSPVGQKNLAVMIRTFSQLMSERAIEIGKQFARELTTNRM